MKRPLPKGLTVWLQNELNHFQKNGTISTSQAESILSQYEPDSIHDNEKKSIAFYTLISASSILAGAALLLLIGYNWEKLNYISKLGLIYGLTILFQAATMLCRFRWKNQYLSEVFSLLSCISFGSGIWLIAQIFNMNAHFPDGFYWWALGSLPLAFLGQSSLLWALVIVLEIIWCFSEASLSFTDNTYIFLGWNTNFPIAAYLMPLLLLPGFFWAYLKNCATTMALHLIAFACWCASLWIAWRFEVAIIPLLGALFAVYWLLGMCQIFSKVIDNVFCLLGRIFIWPTLCVLSFFDLQKELLGLGFNKTRTELPFAALDGLVLLALGFALFYYFLKNKVKQSNSIEPISFKQFLLALVILFNLTLSLGFAALFEPNNSFALFNSLSINFLMLCYSAVLMNDGLRSDSSSNFFLGVGSFMIWTIVRYFDLFGDSGGMLGASLMFFLSSLFLIGLAFFWRNRKGTSYAN